MELQEEQLTPQTHGIGKKPHRDKQWKYNHGVLTNTVCKSSVQSAEMPRNFQVQLHSLGQRHTTWV